MSDRSQLLGAPAKPTADLARQMKQTRFNPLRHTTPGTLAADLDSFEAGYVRKAAMLWEAIEDRDDMARAVISKRKKGVSRRPYEIVLTEQTPAAEAHKAALESFYNHITVSDVLDLNQSGGLPLLIKQMMDAQFKQYAVHEIIWKAGMEIRAELKFCPLYLFENLSGRLRYTGAYSITEGSALNPGEWMITCGDGLMKAISVCWMFKKLSLSDWMNFSERFGLPGIHGETPAAKGSAEWDDFVNALENFANDWIMASAQGCKVNLIESGKTGEAPFKPMVDRMDQAIARLVRGADLGTMSAKDSVGASLQEDETNLLEEDDCAVISDSLNHNLGRFVIAYTFGDSVEPLAYLKINPSQQQDVKLEMDIDNHFEKHGIPLAIQDMAERYGRTLPDPDEKIAGKAEGGRLKEEGKKLPMENTTDAETEALRAAIVTDLKPVYDALAEVLQAKGDDDLSTRLIELDTRWPEIIAAVLDGDATEQAMERLLSAAFVEGLDIKNLVDATLAA